MLLDDLKADITAAFTGELRTGTLYRLSEGVDEYGNPVPGAWALVGTFEGVRGSFDSILAGLSGIPRTDAKIEILASSAASVPLRQDKLQIEGAWWTITQIEIDPAGSWYTCQCAVTVAP